MEEFELFVEKIKEADLRVHGIYLYKKGCEPKEYFFEKNARYPIYSATKSFLSAAVGIAVKEGYFHVQDPIYKYLESGFFDGMTNKRKKAFQKLSIERFLTMSVPNLPFRLQGDDWYSYIENLDADYEAAPDFCYSNICAYLVGVATENAVKKPLMQYMKDKLFDPLEMEIPNYMKDPYGHFYGASGMRLQVKELSKLGILYLQNGRFKNTQVIPVDWIKESSSGKIKNREGGYGYFIWRYHSGYRISGKWGQRSIVVPEKDIVLTYLSDLQENEQSDKMDVMVKEFLFCKT